MSLFDSNRLLWALFLVSLGSAYFTVPTLLQRVKDEARAPEPDPPPPPKRLQKDSENSLKIETLRTLADGHSYELRTSAIKIVASRTIRSSTKNLLFRDLASSDYVRRDNAINAMWMLLYHPALNDTKVTDELTEYRPVASVVEALIHGLAAHDRSSTCQSEEAGKMPPSPLKPRHRQAHEASLLIILNHMLKHHVLQRLGRYKTSSAMDHALRAGLVSRWLAKYPFPCSLPENAKYGFRRSDVARLCERSSWGMDDPLMADIVKEVMKYLPGRRQMLDAGLRGVNSYVENVGSTDGWAPRWHASYDHDYVDDDDDDDDDHDHDDHDEEEDDHDHDHDDHDVVMTGGEDTAGVPLERAQTGWEERLLPVLNSVRPRSVERSQEEEHLRRRHREAIVVADPGAPLRRENILQRENSQFGLRPMNGVSEVEGVLNNLLNLSGAHGGEVEEDGGENSDLPGPNEARIPTMGYPANLQQPIAAPQASSDEEQEAEDHEESTPTDPSTWN
ncbi:uncharacterized protein A1O9_04945 [Exophiala aquamarina CBS 119918]|uniref:Uncharacterized protein n=1 Tax=Exophiala aquamarina CBS 119918 TaxID=1182545 RepID=A0A072PWW5_9EURO|nr:uncharacterized protein A1O9_04945 [Exophiala aquamarina CBS 119918]KEF60095.1 hypothetical protein A1O9_04945 [Exophiala aquamarina CBS 119918]